MGVVNIKNRRCRRRWVLSGHETMRIKRSTRWFWQRERGKKKEQVVARVFKPRSLNALISF